jgi:hypothetical protein
MARFSQYPAATAPTDYVDATNFLIESPDGSIKLANLADLNSSYFSDIQSTSLSIATADVLTLNSTPIELVAAQGAGKVIEILSATVKIVYVSAAYAANTNLQLLTSGATDAQFDNDKLLVATVSTHRRMTGLEPTAATDTQLLENAAVNVTVETGDPTTGDSDIEIFVTYRVITV